MRGGKQKDLDSGNGDTSWETGGRIPLKWHAFQLTPMKELSRSFSMFNHKLNYH